MEQKGIILFGEYVSEPVISQGFPEYQVLQVSLVHPAERRISHGSDFSSDLENGPVATPYGSQLVLSQPEQIGMALQTAFHLW